MFTKTQLIGALLPTLFVFICSYNFSQTISGGGSHCLAICTDKTVRAWGRNTDGRCGDGTTTTPTTPITVVTGASGCATNLCNIIAVAAGNTHSLALKSDGTVWAWGLNTNGQLGDNTTTQRTSPVQVLAGASGCATNLCNITAITAGLSVSVALKSDGTVWTWGLNGNGQLGDGTTTQRNTAVQVSGLTNIIAISASCFGSHVLAIKNDGTVWTWGSNANGQLGDNTTTDRTTAVQVLTGTSGCTTNLCSTTKIAAGSTHSLAIKSDGTLWAWGSNAFNQLGDNTTTQRNTPVQVLTGASGCTTNFCNASKITAGLNFSMAIKSDGSVWGWGLNSSGQLGDNTTTNRATPIQVLTGASGCTTNLCNISKISVGTSSVYAVKSDNTVWAWGTNGAFYRLGDGTTTDRNTPVAPSGICSVTLLPIQILDFSTSCVNNVSSIKWSTMTEKDNNYFTLEKSCDGILFDFMAKINGSGTSFELKEYEFVDENPCSEIGYYRLSQTDFNGNKKVIDVILSNCLETDDSQIYPNPASSKFYISAGKNNIGEIQLFSSTGAVIHSFTEKIEQNQTFEFDISELTKGIYFVHYLQNGISKKIQKLIVF